MDQIEIHLEPHGALNVSVNGGMTTVSRPYENSPAEMFLAYAQLAQMARDEPFPMQGVTILRLVSIAQGGF